jgi:hypothetical protein
VERRGVVDYFEGGENPVPQALVPRTILGSCFVPFMGLTRTVVVCDFGSGSSIV